ncbi:MAG: hypothetical protein K6C95_04455 [Lachnospiraceae bacterium]|nr:hypothetical protein [Lachnospiraceae bacterium]
MRENIVKCMNNGHPETAGKEGFDGFLTKPVVPEELEKEMMRLIPDGLKETA